MHHRGFWTRAAALFALIVATPAGAQAPQQFKANIRMSGGALDGPATGTMYFNGSKLRLELTSSGEQMTIISDPASGSMIMLMPTEKMYMEMPPGSAPVQAPRTRSMDPANPCSGGELTSCMAQGEETVNGYPTRKWQYEIDGETQTAWISTQFRFPVRVVDGSGTTTEYSNVTPGAQPAALFSPPSDYQEMDMGAAMMAAMMGRGGAMPPGVDPAMMGGRGGMPPGFDPASMGRGRGAGPIGPGAGTDPRYAQWEAGDGWVVDFTISGTGAGNGANGMGVTFRNTYSIKVTTSVPLTYGTPGIAPPIPGGTGPAWQLVPTLGSPKALATPFTNSAEAQFDQESDQSDACPINAPSHAVMAVRATGQEQSTNHSGMPIAGIQARWETSQDLSSYTLAVAVGGSMQENTETRVTSRGCSNGPPNTETTRNTREVQWSMSFASGNQRLPASPGNITGSGKTPLRFQIGGFSGEVQADVTWTLRPIR